METGDVRRRTPRTDTVLADPRLEAAVARLGRPRVKREVVRALESCRQGAVAPTEVVSHVLATLPGSATSARPVVNATGVLVHTNLGRAPLSPAAVEALVAAAGATNVELDLATGRRGPRGEGTRDALADAVPAAGDVHVVNNGAAALLLATRALAADREVVVARGEMVEIGDGFRVPELLEAAGARVREVGTTNRVHLADYERAVGPQTGFVLKVHPSNFAVVGFTASVGVRELATLPVPVVADIGSGLLRRHPRLPEEPDADSVLRAGADLVTASADKLLGGPQAGLVLGSSALVARLRRHPMARALRVDKLTLAALEATLRGPIPPVAAALDRDPESLLSRATVLAEAVEAHLGPHSATAVRTAAVVGGGGAPTVELPSAAVAVPVRLAGPLRTGPRPVVGRVADGRLLLDLLAVDESEDQVLVQEVVRAAGEPGA